MRSLWFWSPISLFILAKNVALLGSAFRNPPKVHSRKATKRRRNPTKFHASMSIGMFVATFHGYMLNPHVVARVRLFSGTAAASSGSLRRHSMPSITANPRERKYIVSVGLRKFQESMAKPVLRQRCGVFVLNKLKSPARKTLCCAENTSKSDGKRSRANGVGKRGSTRQSKTLEMSVTTGLYLTLTTLTALTEEILRPCAGAIRLKCESGIRSEVQK